MIPSMIPSLQLIENVKDLFTSDHETPPPQDKIETPKRRTLVKDVIENKTDEIYDLQKYVQSLATEVEMMKLFMKEEFYLPKKSISEINSNTGATNNSITETTENTLIKILAENQKHANKTNEIDSS